MNVQPVPLCSMATDLPDPSLATCPDPSLARRTATVCGYDTLRGSAYPPFPLCCTPRCRPEFDPQSLSPPLRTHPWILPRTCCAYIGIFMNVCLLRPAPPGLFPNISKYLTRYDCRGVRVHCLLLLYTVVLLIVLVH